MSFRQWLARNLSRLACWMPARLRGQFGDEIEQVLSEDLRQAAGRGWLPFLGVVLRELSQFPGIHLRDRLFRRQKSDLGGVIMSNRLDALLHEQHEPTPWGWALIGLLPFFFSWLSLIFTQILKLTGMTLPSSEERSLLIVSYAFFALVVLISVILIFAWTRGFPTWSYTLGLVFLFSSLFLSNASLPGLTLFGYQFGRQILHAYALIPLGAVVAVSLLLTRRNPAQPFVTGFNALTHDFSRLSFGLYGLTPALLRIIFDEVHGEETFLMMVDLFLAACALVYLRNPRTVVGVGAMAAGETLTFFISAVYLGVYWNGRQENWMPDPASGWKNFIGGLSCVIPALLFTLGPWLIQRYAARRRKENL